MCGYRVCACPGSRLCRGEGGGGKGILACAHPVLCHYRAAPPPPWPGSAPECLATTRFLGRLAPHSAGPRHSRWYVLIVAGPAPAVGWWWWWWWWWCGGVGVRDVHRAACAEPILLTFRSFVLWLRLAIILRPRLCAAGGSWRSNHGVCSATRARARRVCTCMTYAHAHAHAHAHVSL